MTDLYEVALEMYARAAALFAQRAGVEPAAPSGKVDPKLIERAGALALGSATPPRETQGAAVPALQSIATHVRLPKEKNGTAQAMPQATGEQARAPYYYYAPQVIAGSAAIPKSQRPADLQATYRNLWQQFEPEWRTLMQDTAMTPQARAESAHALLHRYTWAMAAPGQGDSDVSLFDHARVSAALAVCMVGRDLQDGDPVALLVGGDLSGVQDWLYTIGSEGAAKSLRGRSFYLQLLSEIVALYILDTLKLPPCNLLYAGGGNFYLLIPPDMKNAVVGADEVQGPDPSVGTTGEPPGAETLQTRISRKLLAMHGGALYVALGTAELTESVLRDKSVLRDNVGEAWGIVNRVLGRRKSRRFSELSDEEMAKAIGSGLEGTGILDDSCRVCRRTIGKGEDTRDSDDAEGGRVCGLCHSFEDLGNDLPGAGFLAVGSVREESGRAVTGWQAGLRTFGYDVHLVPTRKKGREWQGPGGDLTRIFYWAQAPDLSQYSNAQAAGRTVTAFRPLAQCAPLGGYGEIVTFDQLQTGGVERWGVLRMDVDRLGQIFQMGIPATNLSRVVGLSGLLRLFFEGYLPEQMRARYNVAKDGGRVPAVYLMYSGGDDLFIVGGWSHLPGLAWDIREWLSDFTGQNPDVTISGGITLALDDKYPLYQAARDADKAEHQAKDAGRDVLTFLGQAVKWGQFEQVRDRAQTIRSWVAPEPPAKADLPRSFLMMLQAIDAEWRRWQERESGALARYGVDPQYRNHGALYLGPWQWHLIYSVARAGEQTRKPPMQQATRELGEAIVKGEIQTLGLVARWVELLSRRSEE